MARDLKRTVAELGAMPHREYVNWAAFYTWEAHEQKKAQDKAKSKKPSRGRRRRR